MQGEIRFGIQGVGFGKSISCALLVYSNGMVPESTESVITIKDGKFEIHKINEYEDLKPEDLFFTISGADAHKVLQAMADGLADYGVYPINKKADEEKIANKVLADERSEHITYLRGINDKVINKFLEK